MTEERNRNNRNEGDIWMGIAAGLVGGLVASSTMDQFQDGAKHQKDLKITRSSVHAAPAKQHQGQTSAENQKDQDDGTVIEARTISEGVFRHELKDSEKEAAGAAIH